MTQQMHQSKAAAAARGAGSSSSGLGRLQSQQQKQQKQQQQQQQRGVGPSGGSAVASGAQPPFLSTPAAGSLAERLAAVKGVSAAPLARLVYWAPLPRLPDALQQPEGTEAALAQLTSFLGPMSLLSSHAP